MRPYFFLPVLLCTFFLAAAPALAASNATPLIFIRADDALASSTVNIYCRLKSGNTVYSTSGSGVFVSERGVVLTNAHVAQYLLLAGEKGRVKGDCTIRTGSPAKDAYTTALLYLSPSWIEANAAAFKAKTPSGTGEGDFALIYVTGAKKGALPASFPATPLSYLNPAEGQSVTVAGYPTGSLNFKEIQKKLLRASDTSTIQNVRGFTSGATDVITIASTSAASAGVSGGPVVSGTGALVGIVSTKSGSLLRAITINHMNARLLRDTSLTLPAMLLGDLTQRAAANRALITPKQIITLRDGLLKKR